MIRKRKRRSWNPFKPHYQTGRERKRAAYRELRPAVREDAWARDRGRCQFPGCGMYVTLDAAHIHEVVFRSAGGSPTDLANVLTLCGKCHLEMHGRIGGALKKIKVLAGGVRRFFARDTGHAPWLDVTERAA